MLEICKGTIGAKRRKPTDCDLSDAIVWKEMPDEKILGHKASVIVS